MDPAAAPPPRPPVLPGLAWLAAAACAFAPLAGVVKQALRGDLSAYGATFGIGLAAAFLLLPWAAAWLVGRVRRDRPSWRVPAFYATLAVLAAGVFWQAAHRANERDEVIDAQAQALANHLTQSGTGAVAAKAPAASPPSTATNDAIIAAQRATKAHLYAAQLAYENAADAVALPGFFDLRPLTSREAIAARRAEVDVFTKAVRLLRETGELAAFQYSSELRDRRVPEAAVRESVAAYREATEKALPRLKRLRDKDGAIALLLDQFLDFAEAELGGWRIDPATDAVEFDRPEARARFDELLQTARVLESERRQLRAEASR